VCHLDRQAGEHQRRLKAAEAASDGHHTLPIDQ
jgi:hypothetical protein